MAFRLGLRASRAMRFQQPIPVRFQPMLIRRAASADAAAVDKEASKEALKAGAKKDPELYVLLAIMCGIFGVAGWHFTRSPTSTNSEANVSKIPGSEPWKSGTSGKYQYHPGGDPSKGVKDAPSALNVVVLPNVNLPKELHETYNRYGKDGYP